MKSNVTRMLSIACFCATATAGGNGATAGETIQNIPTDQMVWETTEEGVGFAPLVGKRFDEAYMAMVKLPAGLVSPAHVKSANMFGVVISGTLTHLAVGEDSSLEVPLSEGAFYKVPAGIGHVSKCISDIDCVTFLYQDGMFDFVPVER